LGKREWYPVFGELEDTYFMVWTVIYGRGHLLLFVYKETDEGYKELELLKNRKTYFNHIQLELF
jgi:hypothetical protein